jgi:succinate dehydrogenase/fumarate reductase flavoprotein subunit
VAAAEYDLVVIGSGPAGQKGAIAAAKARKRVAVIDRTTMMGGVSVQVSIEKRRSSKLGGGEGNTLTHAYSR